MERPEDVTGDAQEQQPEAQVPRLGALDSVVQVRGDINFWGLTVNQRLGSGAFVETADKDKCVVATTNPLVRAEGATVVTSDGKWHRAKEIKRDPDNDLAFLEISGLAAGDCRNLPVGDEEKDKPSKAIGTVPDGFLHRSMSIKDSDVNYYGTYDASSRFTPARQPESKARKLEVHNTEKLEHSFGGGAIVQDDKLVGLIRGGTDNLVISIPPEEIRASLKKLNLQ